ncbi:MAG: threonine synthase [Firmicutes bacterium]|nr:threonine synthase [Bacillota bacterium]
MSDIMYKSTRGSEKKVTASMAIVQGIAEDGGLFVPESIPAIDFTLEESLSYDYRELAYRVLRLLLTDYTEEELRFCINNAYDDKFDTKLIAPVVSAGKYNFLELFHGKTIAFKDMALSILPYLLKTAARKNGVKEDIVILTATSGDTGKAALEGFADVEGTRIIVFYPETGVSPVQKRQMVTQVGKNTKVVAIKGNFDDAQSAVKRIFTDNALKAELKEKGYVFSSANSINIGRLAPQIVYYFYAYTQMVKSGKIKVGQEVNFTVPTGNFGDILAGYYAKHMGLPVNKLICASNDNKVLFDFFETGVYDINRDFILTPSPSMDILISSNFERLLYHSCEDTEKISSVMGKLSKEGKYSFEVNKEFAGEYATTSQTLEAVKELFEATNYVMDTHTAVAYASYKKYVANTGDNTENVIVSTASPFKFAKDVLKAIDEKYEGIDPFKALEELEKVSKISVPAPIKGIDKRPVLHEDVIERENIEAYVKKQLIG